jgi:hypothetical protein
MDEFDERTQEAWATYRESLRDLTGREYDEAEDRSWAQLQRELEAIGELRSQLTLADGLSAR